MNYYSGPARTRHIAKAIARPYAPGTIATYTLQWAIDPRELVLMPEREQAVTTLYDEYGAVYSTREFLTSVAWPAAMWDFTLIGQEFS